MGSLGFVGLGLIIVNVAFSYKGFKDFAFFERYSFEVDRILIDKDYKRLVTSGFLHVDWFHLLFNMFSLYAFSRILESTLGELDYFIIYLASLIGGNLFALYINRNYGDYSAVGASGAVCGIIFASIALFPGMGIQLFGLPVSIPSWLYGVGFVLGSIYGIRSKRDNIGHEAHLGGALVGLAVAIIMQPSALADNWLTIILIVVPSAAFIYIIARRPELLYIPGPFHRQRRKRFFADDAYNADKTRRQKQVNDVLDKINRSGINSLTKKERKILDDFSQFK